jgi:hypothetical protein
MASAVHSRSVVGIAGISARFSGISSPRSSHLSNCLACWSSGSNGSGVSNPPNQPRVRTNFRRAGNNACRGPLDFPGSTPPLIKAAPSFEARTHPRGEHQRQGDQKPDRNVIGNGHTARLNAERDAALTHVNERAFGWWPALTKKAPARAGAELGSKFAKVPSGMKAVWTISSKCPWQIKNE